MQRMNSDPFAVWEDPAPATPSTSTTKAAQVARPDEPKLSLEFEDDDPGWDVASASTSRANSPVKTRKQSSAKASAAVSPINESGDLAGFDTSEQKEAKPVSASTSELPEEKAPAATQEEEAPTEELPGTDKAGGDANLATATGIVSAEAASANGDHDDEEEDALEDSRQEQVDRTGESVTPEEFAEKATIATLVEAEKGADEDDGFDDFGEPAEAGADGAANDDFGDFDDFETGDASIDDGFGDDGFGDDGFDEPAPEAQVAAPTQQPPSAPAPTRDWAPLNVTSSSNRSSLADSVNALLPLSTAAEKELTTAPLRQVEGASQVLVSGESRQLWADLSSFPSVKPIDWVRSRTRRDYLISMGVPVNLDEIHSSFASGSGGSKQLPLLQLKYVSSANRASTDGSSHQRSSSLKVAGTATGASSAQRSASTSNSPRNGTQSPASGSSTNRERIAERRREELGLGPAPQVDLRRAEELVNKTEDQLTLLSLPALKSMLRELNTLTTSTSSLLTHHLTLRESYQADSEMYNSMIKELVTGAASRFSGDNRKSTTMATSQSSSGAKARNSTPPGGVAMAGSRSMSPSLRGGAASKR